MQEESQQESHLEVPIDMVSKWSFGPVTQQSVVVPPLAGDDGGIFVGIISSMFQINVPSIPRKTKLQKDYHQ